MASARDILLIAVVIFGFGLAFLAIHYVMGIVVNEVVTNPIVNESEGSVAAFNNITNMTNRMDYVIFGVFIGMCLALIVTGYFVGGNGLFMFFYFLVITVTVAVSAVFANVWNSIAQDITLFGTSVNYFPITNNILVRLPVIMVAVGFIGLVVMFIKPFSEGGFK